MFVSLILMSVCLPFGSFIFFPPPFFSHLKISVKKVFKKSYRVSKKEKYQKLISFKKEDPFIHFVQDCLWIYQLIQCLLQYEYLKNTYINPVISGTQKLAH